MAQTTHIPGFAEGYLEKHNVTQSISFDIQPDICVIIPCYNEPELVETLDSIFCCTPPHGNVCVLVVVNSYRGAPHHAISQNQDTLTQIVEWKGKNIRRGFELQAMHITDIPPKKAGAGLARKAGMDEVLWYFSRAGKENGLIVSLDADCTCATNYLTEIENHFVLHPACDGVSVYFEHPVEGNRYASQVYDAAAQYELHLRYFIEVLRSVGFPFAFHTIGSCFAVTARAYYRQGGMNSRMAGEDFYFLQKIIEGGIFHEINSTVVYPSPRPSRRMPFGTGPAIAALLEKEDRILDTYHPWLFDCLGQFLSHVPDMFHQTTYELEKIVASTPEPLREFLYNSHALAQIPQIVGNSGNQRSFTKRFYRWFNAFMVIKYLNQSSCNRFSKIPVKEAAMDMTGRRYPGVEKHNIMDLLYFLREKQREENFVNPLL